MTARGRRARTIVQRVDDTLSRQPDHRPPLVLPLAGWIGLACLIGAVFPGVPTVLCRTFEGLAALPGLLR